MAYTPKETITVRKTITLAGNGATTTNVFLLTGSVRIHEIGGTVTEATNSTTLQNVALILYDGTNTVDITKSDEGTDCSATTVGSFMYKGQVETAAITYEEADQCRFANVMQEGSGYGTVVTAKNGVATYIKVSFTGDADTDTDVQFFAKYTPLSVGSSITAA